ncbi:uncharacterized protein PAC_03575 [Phialocephala subalpina]|uniref:Uncharacterized protein n=1 Tax=Phialocephala subalpina TaxID=576137 RepID=A0A1L7WLQ6_9HELO|nr:uncharacterized protein PAC_03575 [Phialocephala subalpina]
MWNSSDIVLPPIATTPVDIPWNIILLVVYLPSIIFLYCFTAARKAHNFSEGGWTALFIVRIVEGLFGLVVPLAVANGNVDMRRSVEWMAGLPCSLLHDLGTFCIVLSLTRALFLALDIWDWTWLNILRRLWGWIMVLLPIPGYFLAGIMVSFLVNEDSQLQVNDSKMANGYNNAAYSVLRANIASLGTTLVVMAPFFLFIFIKRRRGQIWASSTASSTAMVFFPTLILMIVYLITDMLRFIPGHTPSIIQHFALGLAPEVLVTVTWLFLARKIGKCDKDQIRCQDSLRECMREGWDRDIDRTLGMHSEAVNHSLEKYTSAEDISIVNVKGVYDCAMYRLERLHQDFLEDVQTGARNFEQEAKDLIEDAKANAKLVAECLFLMPCDGCPLFGRYQLECTRGTGRPMFSEEKTAKLVLEAMKEDDDLKILNAEEKRWAARDFVRIHLS